MHLSKRIATVLQIAGLTPRDLSAATHIHYSTIYNMIRGGEEYNFTPLTEDVLHTALGRVETLVDEGQLPLKENVSAKERRDRLLSMLAVARN